ncbi:hypothetical protein B0H19DRAFT_1158271 [Mycena capillaripes]|nr:hypothetical protein B0H19DRAFT_1158271 [Mycena capillaripes]
MTTGLIDQLMLLLILVNLLEGCLILKLVLPTHSSLRNILFPFIRPALIRALHPHPYRAVHPDFTPMRALRRGDRAPNTAVLAPDILERVGRVVVHRLFEP